MSTSENDPRKRQNAAETAPEDETKTAGSPWKWPRMEPDEWHYLEEGTGQPRDAIIDLVAKFHDEQAATSEDFEQMARWTRRGRDPRLRPILVGCLLDEFLTFAHRFSAADAGELLEQFTCRTPQQRADFLNLLIADALAERSHGLIELSLNLLGEGGPVRSDEDWDIALSVIRLGATPEERDSGSHGELQEGDA